MERLWLKLTMVEGNKNEKVNLELFELKGYVNNLMLDLYYLARVGRRLFRVFYLLRKLKSFITPSYLLGMYFKYFGKQPATTV